MNNFWKLEEGQLKKKEVTSCYKWMSRCIIPLHCKYLQRYISGIDRININC